MFVLRTSCSVIPLSCTIFLLCGCQAVQQKAEARLAGEGTQASVMTYPATIRGAYFRMGGRPFVCAEPSPDAAGSESLKVAVKTILEGSASAALARKSAESESSASGATSGKGEVDSSVEHATAIVALAGRSELVLVVRESLYRVCEATYNHPGLSVNQVMKLYSSALENIAEIAKAIRVGEETKKADAEARSAEADLKKRQTQIFELELKEVKGGVRSLVIALSKPCVDENTKCASNAKDVDARNKCDAEQAKCIQNVLKSVTK